MVSAQKWLDKHYPKEERKEITKLSDGGVHNIFDVYSKLEGDLDLSDFVNLKEIILADCRITELNISNCIKITKLDCSQSQLNDLNLDKNAQLVELYCSNNQLRELNLSNCSNLQRLHCNNNLLTNLDLSANSQLEFLSISDNNFTKQDLNFLTHLTGLQTVNLGNENAKQIKKGIYNHFIGSLQPLQKLTNLKTLNVKNTDINEGLEYLPDSLEKFIFSAELRKEAKVKKIEQILKYYNNDIKKWRKVNKTRQAEELLKEEASMSSSITNYEPSTNEVANWEVQAQELQSQLNELNNIICPENDFNFTNLKKEIQRLKAKELIPQWQNKKSQLTDLTTTLQNKVGNELKSIVALYLQIQEQMISQEQENNTFTQGQLTAYQSILGQKVSEKELLELTQLQKEVVNLKRRLGDLDLKEQEYQIEVPPKGNN